MVRIIPLDQIKSVLKPADIIQAIEDGFVAYSEGKVVVPPVGEMIFENPPGDIHIKYGYIKNDDVYVIKIASGFYENPKLGLSSGNGLILVFSQKTGEIETVLLDECFLTDARTAAAGAVAARHLGQQEIKRIGIVGAGIQGRIQLDYLRFVTACRDALVWGQNQDELDSYQTDMSSLGFTIETTLNTADIPSSCDLIVTTTPSKEPLLQAGDIQPGTHITAVGSDTAEKIELDPAILAKADLVVADSISQCQSRGEIFQALKTNIIQLQDIVELGNVISGKASKRTDNNQITIADLSGVAVQDIQIAKSVLKNVSEKPNP